MWIIYFVDAVCVHPSWASNLPSYLGWQSSTESVYHRGKHGRAKLDTIQNTGIFLASNIHAATYKESLVSVAVLCISEEPREAATDV